MTKKTAIKRDIFAELVEGFNALAKQREGKLIMRTLKLQSKSASHLNPHDKTRSQNVL